MVTCLSTMWETWVPSLGWEDPLEKEMGPCPRSLLRPCPRSLLRPCPGPSALVSVTPLRLPAAPSFLSASVTNMTQTPPGRVSEQLKLAAQNNRPQLSKWAHLGRGRKLTMAQNFRVSPLLAQEVLKLQRTSGLSKQSRASPTQAPLNTSSLCYALIIRQSVICRPGSASLRLHVLKCLTYPSTDATANHLPPSAATSPDSLIAVMTPTFPMMND